MNPFEQLLAAIAPRAALKRQAARLQLEQMRRYDGAARGRRTDNWVTQGSSADAATARGFGIMRDRARDLVRNNPYAKKAVESWVTNLIGAGWSFKAKQSRRNGRQGERVTEIMRAWMADPRQCDYHGIQNFDGLMAQAVRCWKESGEVLIRMRTPSRQAVQRLGLTIPLQLQVMEGDWIDETHDTPAMSDTAGWTKRGIVYDAEGRRDRFWIYNYHPGESAVQATAITSNTVPADEIIHLFTPERPGMTRGVSCLAPVMVRLRDLGDLLDARLMKEKVAACLSAAVVDLDGTSDQKSTIGERLEPGAVVRLGPGQDIRAINPPAAGEIDRVIKTYLLEIAAGIGITYEELTGDYSGGSFTQGRMGWIGFQRRLQSDTWQVLAPLAFNRVAEWAFNAMNAVGIATDGIAADWTPPRRELFDPQSETNSTISRVRAGLLPPQEAIRADGYEPDEVVRLIQEWNQLLDAAGIVLDTDPRKVSAAGLTQVRPLGSTLPPTGEPPVEAEQPPAPAAPRSPSAG
ncbi:phage portal protein [Cyanobium sp.]|nr:phage portal protein [Cyanobium sp.]